MRKLRLDCSATSLLCVCAGALLLASNAAAADTTKLINLAWLPVTDAERKLAEPLVDKSAGMEALFWRAHIYDEFQGDTAQRVMHHYVRLKVFNAAGKEKASSLDIEFDQDASILSIAGRTIKADGTILELGKEGVHERDLVRSGRLKRRVKTLSMPGVEPGAIVEYRWKEVRFKPSNWYLRLQFQRDYPIQKVAYLVKPISSDYAVMPTLSLWPFNCKPAPLKLENDGFNSTTVENMPAFKEEPLMLGQPNVRAWALLFYREDKDRQPEKYWNEIGKDVYQHLKRAIKVTDEVKQATAKALEGVKEDEKTLALIRYIRKNVRDFSSQSVTEAERTAVLKSIPKGRWRTSADVLKSGIGMSDEMNTLFAAMASHAGIEARPALVADREDILFNPQMAEQYFLRSVDMAVKVGEEWKLLDVSASRLPAGMLSWREEGMKALVSDPKKPFFIESVVSPPEASETSRKATLTLSEDGSLQGDIEEVYTGHAAAERRADFDRESDARRQELLKEELTKVMPKAELSAMVFENVDEPESPLKIRYTIKVPEYAQRTGKRLFFQPLFFQRGSSPLFESSERKYDVYFHYAWKESDELSISLPAGFSLDSPDRPDNLSFGDAGGYKVEMATDGIRLICRRQLIFGAKGLIGLKQATYPMLKQGFDEIHRRDSHTISLRQAATAGSGGL